MVHAHVKVNPLTPKRDHDRMSPYKIVYVINKQTCDANKEKYHKGIINKLNIRFSKLTS